MRFKQYYSHDRARLALVVLAVVVVFSASAYMYLSAQAQYQKTVEAIVEEKNIIPEPEDLIVLSDYYYDNAYKKMAVLGFLVFGSAFLLLLALPREEEEAEQKRREEEK